MLKKRRIFTQCFGRFAIFLKLVFVVKYQNMQLENQST